MCLIYITVRLCNLVDVHRVSEETCASSFIVEHKSGKYRGGESLTRNHERTDRAKNKQRPIEVSIISWE
jgi:hypothetical protein